MISHRITACVLGVITHLPTAANADTHHIVHGMTVSCQTWGWEWGTDDMVVAMEELRDIGVNWIAIHPYARIREDGHVSARRLEVQDADWLRRPIAEAHRRGLKILIKPHLAYWGSPFEWRGAISFDDPDHWAVFFDSYRTWIVTVARMCHDADAFCVGTELDRTIEHVDAWRQIIAEVRTVTPAPLTYAANWTDYERVAFWDDLDVIGIQAYFPLVDHDTLPPEEELREAWAQVVRRLEVFARRTNRRIVFTELGYNLSNRCARQPWDARQGGAFAEVAQQRCLTTALSAIDNSPHICGAFLWKWFAGPAHHENFLKSTPAMRAVIRSRWKN